MGSFPFDINTWRAVAGDEGNLSLRLSTIVNVIRRWTALAVFPGLVGVASSLNGLSWSYGEDNFLQATSVTAAALRARRIGCGCRCSTTFVGEVRRATRRPGGKSNRQPEIEVEVAGSMPEEGADVMAWFPRAGDDGAGRARRSPRVLRVVINRDLGLRLLSRRHFLDSMSPSRSPAPCVTMTAVSSGAFTQMWSTGWNW